MTLKNINHALALAFAAFALPYTAHAQLAAPVTAPSVGTLFFGGQQQSAAPSQAQPSAPVTPPAPASAAPAVAAVPTLPAIAPSVPVPRDAFEEAIKKVIPVTPEQARDANQKVDKFERATNAYPGLPPKGVSSSVQVQLTPGRTPSVIRISATAVTAVVATDVSGAPWPITRVVVGADALLQTSEIKADAGGKFPNSFTISAKTVGAMTNLAVFLEGAPAPLIFDVVSDGRFVDYVLNVQVQQRGPNASRMVMTETYDQSLPIEFQSAVDGVTPDGAKVLTVSGADASAWLIGRDVLIRTKLNILAPAPTKAGASADGETKVYLLPNTPSVITLMTGGRAFTAILTGFPTPTQERIEAAQASANAASTAQGLPAASNTIQGRNSQ